MKRNFSRTLFLSATLALLLQGGTALGGTEPDPASAPPAAAVDWAANTKELLADLKGRLALSDSQKEAWGAWSAATIDDARVQGEGMQALTQARAAQWNPDLTTPERMARKADLLKTRLALMQAHLTRVEAALQRTRDFYDRLDGKQKTIFDLFWGQDYRGDLWPGRDRMMFGQGCFPPR